MIITNEFIFLLYLIAIGITLLGALRFGKEALCTVLSVQWILANLFVVKNIDLFGFEATASDALAVGAMLGLNLLREFYGRRSARQAIVISFFAMLFYTAVSLLHVLYIPAATDIMHAHFCAVLSPMPRILLASCIVYVIVEFLDYYMYNKLLIMFNKRFFIFRNYCSIGISQFVDTVLFSILALYGTVPSIIPIIIISYLLKIIILMLNTPFLALAKLIMHKEENSHV